MEKNSKTYNATYTDTRYLKTFIIRTWAKLHEFYGVLTKVSQLKNLHKFHAVLRLLFVPECYTFSTEVHQLPDIRKKEMLRYISDPLSRICLKANVALQ